MPPDPPEVGRYAHESRLGNIHQEICCILTYPNQEMVGNFKKKENLSYLPILPKNMM